MNKDVGLSLERSCGTSASSCASTAQHDAGGQGSDTPWNPLDAAVVIVRAMCHLTGSWGQTLRLITVLLTVGLMLTLPVLAGRIA